MLSLVSLLIQKIQFFIRNKILLVVSELHKFWVSLARSSEASVSSDILVSSPIMDDLWLNDKFLDLCGCLKFCLCFGIGFLIDNPLSFKSTSLWVNIFSCETLDRFLLFWSITGSVKGLP